MIPYSTIIVVHKIDIQIGWWIDHYNLLQFDFHHSVSVPPQDFQDGNKNIALVTKLQEL